MKRFNFRLLMIALFCGAAASPLLLTGTPQFLPHSYAQSPDSRPTMTIGSPAPSIDIENWVQDGNGFFKPVTEFEAGKVYVVEFWATWCGPCIASMPHLASLQNKYRGRDVQLISISDEDLETVEEFLEKETKNADDETTTFKEITSAYCLTSDPDRSVHDDYMKAAQQGGIPTAFIVGKDGLVEWIGHPMRMDEPLEMVVEGKWNREEFKKEFEAESIFNQAIQSIGKLANTGKFKEAIEDVDKQLESDIPAGIRERWVMIRQQLKLAGGMIDDELMTYFHKELEAAKGKPMEIVRHARSFYQVSRETSGLEPLLKSAAVSLKQELENAKAAEKAILHDTLAKVNHALGDLDAAIASQEAAVESAAGRVKQQMQRELDALKSQKEKPDTDEAPDAEPKE